MLTDPALQAFVAVLDSGSFDGAAARLGLTQPAVSQRLRTLEDRLGTALIVRGQPAQATEAGRALQTHAEAVALLEHRLSESLGLAQTEGPVDVRLAVNADSLETWFLPVLAQAKTLRFKLTIDDQDHTHRLLREGAVAAAITGAPGPVHGCDSFPLGALRYHAVIKPDLAAKWFPDGVTEEALAAAPALSFGRKDALQSRWAGLALGTTPPPLLGHVVPTASAFLNGTLQGLGWGMNPEPLVAEHIKAGRLVALGPPLDTPLFWQVSRLVAPALAPLTKLLRQRAAEALYQSS